MEEKELTQNDVIEQIKKATENFNETSFVENIISNNVITFDYNEDKYRVSKPSFKTRQEVNKKRIEKFNELLKDETQLFEKQIIESYKKKGIDIEEKNEKIANLENARQELLLKLGKFISEKKPKEELDTFRQEVTRYNQDIKELLIEKNLLLDSSIEAQLKVFIYTYLAYLIVEKLRKEEDKEVWFRPWKNYDEFSDEDEEIINTFIWYTMVISKNEFS